MDDEFLHTFPIGERQYLRSRLELELAHQAKIAAGGFRDAFFHLDKWYSAGTLVKVGLAATGLYWRARRNASQIAVKKNLLFFHSLPTAFEGFTILQVSDLHADQNKEAIDRAVEILGDLQCDLCVLTGDYRGKTYGEFDVALREVQRVRSHIKSSIYAVLGNHDSVRMLPQLSAMDISILINTNVFLQRGMSKINLVGIDDANFYCADGIKRLPAGIAQREFSILLSHTPEVYREAAEVGFDLMLSGHTHGGQLCLPGSVPIQVRGKLPRRLAAGAWTYLDMKGYTSSGVGTSVLPVRLNCPPEITLHVLHRCD